MAINIRNANVERLADEPGLLCRRVLDFLETEIWPTIPKNHLGRRLKKNERERILGYGKRGV
jgi:hypothetical protein